MLVTHITIWSKIIQYIICNCKQNQSSCKRRLASCTQLHNDWLQMTIFLLVLSINPIVVTNYELLCDVETMMRLMCVFAMLEIVQILSELVQNENCFICDFVPTMKFKFIQVDLYNLYVDLKQHISHG